MKEINRSDVQGMLIYAYKYLPFAHYLFLKIESPTAFRTWLKNTSFQNGASSPRERCMNIAFTKTGLEQLGIEVKEENGFSRPFIEGMDTQHRNRILGDFDANGSTEWHWGNQSQKELHAVLMLFGKDKLVLDALYQEQSNVFEKHGIKEIVPKIESAMLHEKEHFGFKDGISQPVMRGLGRTAAEEDFVNPGEFTLGYPNNYNKLPNSPFLQKHQFDLGNNGSYMVFRQLEQNVPLFWKTLCNYFGGPEKGKQEAIALASKMVGRWPNGNPLSKEATDVISDKDLNKFSFYKEDRDGMKCPFGSHIRRTNPRDSLSDSGKSKDLKEAIAVANNHRILRRGRPYGIPVSENMEIESMIQHLNEQSEEGRGLNFICFNTDIERQFEFIQQTWANNRKFHELYEDVDPIMGVQRLSKDKMCNTQFEVQADPVRQRYKNIPPFVKVKGGSYFFMPGITALSFLSNETN